MSIPINYPSSVWVYRRYRQLGTGREKDEEELEFHIRMSSDRYITRLKPTKFNLQVPAFSFFPRSLTHMQPFGVRFYLHVHSPPLRVLPLLNHKKKTPKALAVRIQRKNNTTYTLLHLSRSPHPHLFSLSFLSSSSSPSLPNLFFLPFQTPSRSRLPPRCPRPSTRVLQY